MTPRAACTIILHMFCEKGSSDYPWSPIHRAPPPFLHLCFFRVVSEEKNFKQALHPQSQIRPCWVTSWRRRSCFREKRIVHPSVHTKNFSDFGAWPVICFASVYLLLKWRAHEGSGHRSLDRGVGDGVSAKCDSEDVLGVVESLSVPGEWGMRVKSSKKSSASGRK
jgi:hypothetical protein